jgi:exosome complex exonuclease RRP6
VPQSSSQAEDEAPKEIDEVSGMQVEIPYVPASQRPTRHVIQDEKDTIVVVGQARQKRKRKKGEQIVDKGDTMEAEEPFDFLSVSNILDTDSNGGDQVNDDENSQRKRLRRKKNG